jgi:hypothetical protein
MTYKKYAFMPQGKFEMRITWHNPNSTDDLAASVIKTVTYWI